VEQEVLVHLNIGRARFDFDIKSIVKCEDTAANFPTSHQSPPPLLCLLHSRMVITPSPKNRSTRKWGWKRLYIDIVLDILIRSSLQLP